MAKTGIYKITNPNGRIYIGQSVDIGKRFASYKRLCIKIQRQYRLYGSLLKYGVENHLFEIIEECERDELNLRERFWQDHYNVLSRKGMNCVLVETNQKPRVLTEELKARMSQSKMGIPAWNKGLPTWESTKKTINERYCPLKRKSSKIILDTNSGVYFYCLREAAIAYGMPKQTLRMNLSAPNKDCKKNKTHLIYT